MTASALGSTVGVSESTVVRFSYAVGFGGYPELQSAMQDMIRTQITSTQRVQLAAEIPAQHVLRTTLTNDLNNLRDTVEMTETDEYLRLIDCILKGKRFYLVGNRRMKPLAEYFAYYLRFLIKDVTVVDSMEQGMIEHLLDIGEEDVCFAISFPRYGRRTVDAVRYAKEHGAKIVVLTDNENAPVAQFADHVVFAKCGTVSFADSLAAPTSVLSAILTSIGIERREELEKRFEQLEAVWEAEEVYTGGR